MTDLESRIAELGAEKLGMLTTIFNLEQKVAELERRNVELIKALEIIDAEICSFCTKKLCFKLYVEKQSGIYRMCDRREILQSAIRAGKDV